MQLGKLLFSAFVVVVGFLMIVLFAQALVQFLGIIVIVLGIGAAVFTDMQKSSAPTHH